MLVKKAINLKLLKPPKKLRKLKLKRNRPLRKLRKLSLKSNLKEFKRKSQPIFWVRRLKRVSRKNKLRKSSLKKTMNSSSESFLKTKPNECN